MFVFIFIGSSDELTSAEKGGIAAGVVLFVALVTLLFVVVLRQKRRVDPKKNERQVSFMIIAGFPVVHLFVAFFLCFFRICTFLSIILLLSGSYCPEPCLYKHEWGLPLFLDLLLSNYHDCNREMIILLSSIITGLRMNFQMLQFLTRLSYDKILVFVHPSTRWQRTSVIAKTWTVSNSA